MRRLLAPVAVAVAMAGAVAVAERLILARLDPMPDPATDGGLTFPADRVHRVATPDGGLLHVEESGTGRPVVLLHGDGSNRAIFAPLARRLASDGQRAVAVDQRGFGRSSAVPPAFGFGGLVDDAATVLEALDLHDAVVVGHSLGGAVALGLALDHPLVVQARVAGLVLVNSSARGPADRPLVRARAALLDWPPAERIGRHPRHGLALTRVNFGTPALRSHVTGVRAVGFASPAVPRRGLTRRLLGIDLTARLGEVGVPVLVLAGGSDRVLPPHESARIAAGVADGRLEVLSGAGHVLPVERSAEVADRILRFP